MSENIFKKPEFGDRSFMCPHCGVYSQMTFSDADDIKKTAAHLENILFTMLKNSPKPLDECADEQDCASCNFRKDSINAYVKDIKDYLESTFKVGICKCECCGDVSVWSDKKLVYPLRANVPPANKYLSDEITKIYNEAASVAILSPISAAALLRLALQKLFVELEVFKNSINETIITLHKKAKIDDNLKELLDNIRFSGNNAVHVGCITLEDDDGTILYFFEAFNRICEILVEQPIKDKELNKKLQEAQKG